MSHRFARNGWPQANEFVVSPTITASATPHAEGAYSEIVASLSRDVSGMIVRAVNAVNQSGVDTSMLLSFAVGAAAAEVDVISNVDYGGFAGGTHQFYPLRIRAGARLAAKLRAEQVSDTIDLQINLLYGSQPPSWGGYSVCETFGAVTAESRGTALSGSNAWTELSASTPNPLRAVSLACGSATAAQAAGVHVVDIGVGPAASEQVIGTWIWETTSAEACLYRAGPPFIERPIPAGSRLAVRRDIGGSPTLNGVVLGWR